jgi:hypothetical protein
VVCGAPAGVTALIDSSAATEIIPVARLEAAEGVLTPWAGGVNSRHLRANRIAAQTADVQAADKSRFCPHCRKAACSPKRPDLGAPGLRHFFAAAARKTVLAGRGAQNFPTGYGIGL